jgi:FixJ family two-component response regulator
MTFSTLARPSGRAVPHVPLARLERILGFTAAEALERYSRLTRREREVASEIAADRPKHEIAAEMGISIKTIDIHRTNVRNKLHAETIAQVANVVHLAHLTANTR